MKKKISQLYLLLFLLVICLPWLFAFFLEAKIDAQNYENRKTMQKPVLSIETYKNYPAEYEAYFNDSIPFRNAWITFHSWLNYRLFHTSVNSDVILGKNKWLFYGSVGDGNPVGDYEGTNTFSEEEIARMEQAAGSLQRRLQEMGIQSAVLIAPNKERIYGQYMPDYYIPSDDSRADLMANILRKAQVNVINPKEELLELKSKYQLYYAYDTHWNQLGAYVGTRAVLKTWGIEMPAITTLTVASAKLKDQYHICGLDDLANMLHLRQIAFQDEMEYTLEENYCVDWQQISDALVHIENAEAPCRQTVFIVGDSFRVSMIPALAAYFSDVYAVHRSSYTFDMLQETAPDYFIAEYVERYAGQLSDVEQMILGR